MSVHQKKDGRWICQYRIKGTGKLKTEYFGRGPENERRARDRDQELGFGRQNRRRTPQKNSAFFTELANSYLEAKFGLLAESSLEILKYKLEGILIPYFGHLQAAAIAPHIADRFVIKRLKDGVKRTTIHRDLSDVSAILGWAAKRRYIPKNPLQGYEKPERDNERIRPPTKREILSIIRHSPPHLVRAETLSYYCGIRPGARELFSRRWDDVDFDEKTIYVVSAKKGGNLKSRNIPLHPNLLRLLTIWDQEDHKFEAKKGFFPERIIHYRGQPVKSLKTSWKKAKEEAGIKRRIRLYDLRHAFASYALKNQADLKSVSQTLGHSRVDTTLNIYQHTDTDMHRDAINRVPDLDL